MLRVNRAKKSKKVPLADNIKSPFVARSLLIALLISLFFISSAAAKRFLLNSDYFRVKSVESSGVEKVITYREKEVLEAFLGKNTFKVNLKEVSDMLKKRHPEFKDIIVRRVLPDRLKIDATVTRPVALVMDHKYVPVDSEGVILYDIDSSTWKKLPLITGFDVSPRERMNRRCDSMRLKITLGLLAAIEESQLLAEHDLNSIDASNRRNISFYLEDGLEVKIGNERFGERLEVLKKVLRDPKLSLSRMKYVDLRFEDAVIGTK